ncbi:MAG: hypothetical protein AB7Y46_00165 [Armatimonadota bacterium]
MNRLEGLRQRPLWITHLGSVLGCLEYLNIDLSPSWVYGGSGHAFVINVHELLCPSGPTAWDTSMLDQLGGNLGYLVDGVHSHRSHDDFPARQAIAWALVRGCIDTGVPCYAWELAAPEWYVITGYDDVGYYYDGPGAQHGTQPLPWQSLAETEIGWLSVHCVLHSEAEPDDVAVREALTFALGHARGRYSNQDYATGPRAFEVWAEALETGRADRFGAGYNGVCWLECREMAVAFLREAKRRLPGRADALFDEALEHYSAVHQALKAAVERVPFQSPAEEVEGARVQDPQAAALIRAAGAAEARALDVVARLCEAMQ